MDSTWSLMQETTAAGYMYRHKQWLVNPPSGSVHLPYPESGHISGILFKRFTEEKFLGLMLMLGPPPHAIRLEQVSHHNAYLDKRVKCHTTEHYWLEKLKDFRIDGFILTNAMKEYHNFEFLRQLENHDG